jgi:hypothetical protein
LADVQAFRGFRKTADLRHFKKYPQIIQFHRGG